jgi:prepilin peptidase CpaA
MEAAMPHDNSLPLFVLLSVLGCALTAAIWHDIRTYRVPNAIVVGGTLAAFALHSLQDGAVAAFGVGIAGAAMGFATGFFLFLPFYLIRAAGAGDVKLMAMVGAFLGPLDMIATYVWTCAAGACFAVIFAMKRRVLGKMARNILSIARSALPRARGATGAAHFDPYHSSAAKLPYSVAIAAGTAVWMSIRLMH